MFKMKLINDRKREELMNKAEHERNDVVFSWMMKTSYENLFKLREILEANHQEHVAKLFEF